MQVPIGSLILAGLIVGGLFVVVPRVAPGILPPTSQCSGPAPTATPTLSPGAATPTTLPATPTPIGPAGPNPTTAPGVFRPVGSMTTARAGATATLLKDGRVLVVGGSGNGEGGPLTSAELYDPASCEFRSTGSMPAPRATAVTLLDDGAVLFAGGFDGSAGSLASALLYDPSAGSFTQTGSMTTARIGASATRLQDGRVLIAGGESNPQGDAKFLATAEIYDPLTRTFSATGSMLQAQQISVAVLLANGKVLFIGGGQDLTDSPAPAELCDPATGTFSPTGSMVAGWAGAGSATVLSDGRVLVLGEAWDLPMRDPPTLSAIAETYDPKTGTFTAAASPSVLNGSPILLGNGKVLILGDHSAQLYDVNTGTYASTGLMATTGVDPTVAVLQDGKVLLAGGRVGRSPGYSPAVASAEIFEP